jgi:hypothetical protein
MKTLIIINSFLWMLCILFLFIYIYTSTTLDIAKGQRVEKALMPYMAATIITTIIISTIITIKIFF